MWETVWKRKISDHHDAIRARYGRTAMRLALKINKVPMHEYYVIHADDGTGDQWLHPVGTAITIPAIEACMQS